MPDGASQSAIDLRCKTARDPQKTLHFNQTRMPWPGCCLSHNRMLAVIMPECAGGVAPPEFIKWLHYSENRAWTWPCELDSPSLTAVLSKTSHANCHRTLTNRPSRGRRGRFVRVVQQLACEVFARTAVAVGHATRREKLCRQIPDLPFPRLKVYLTL